MTEAALSNPDGYVFSVENGAVNLPELEPLYREHQAEMQALFAGRGIPLGSYNPRYDEYLKAWNGGWLLNYVARLDGAPVGHCNIYLTSDMNTHDPVALECNLFVTKAHRRGVGRKLFAFAMEDVRGRGVKRLQVSAATDPRAAKLWERMGFKQIAVQMAYSFEEA